jgi:alpha,alpha-trehalase
MQPRNINICELNGGIVMSPYETEVQWDCPYGWARLQLIAVEGLRNYELDADADRIPVKFLSTVMENFQRDATMREKCNMVTGSSEFQGGGRVSDECCGLWLNQPSVSGPCRNGFLNEA